MKALIYVIQVSNIAGVDPEFCKKGIRSKKYMGVCHAKFNRVVPYPSKFRVAKTDILAI